MRGLDGKERAETSPTKCPMKTDSHVIIIRYYWYTGSCMWHLHTYNLHQSNIWQHHTLYRHSNGRAPVYWHTELIQMLLSFRSTHGPPVHGWCLFCDGSSLTPGAGIGNRTPPKKEDESDQLLILAVMSTVLTTRYILPQWAIIAPVYAKQKKHEDIWWPT